MQPLVRAFAGAPPSAAGKICCGLIGSSTPLGSGWKIVPDGAGGWRLLPKTPLLPVYEADAHAKTEGKAYRQLRKADPAAVERALLAGATKPVPLIVLARSLTTAETDARRLRRKNKAMIGVAIAESKKEAAKNDRVARLAGEQIRAVRIIAALSNSSGSSHTDP